MNVESQTKRVVDVALGDVIRPFGEEVTVVGTGGLGPGEWALQYVFSDGRRDSHRFAETARVEVKASTHQDFMPTQLTVRPGPAKAELGLFQCEYLHGSTGRRVSMFHVEAGTLPMARAIARIGWQGDGMDSHTLSVVSVERGLTIKHKPGSGMQAKEFILKLSTFLRANSSSVKALPDGGEQFNLNDGSFIECDKWGNRQGFAPNGWCIASGTVRKV